MHTVLSKNAMKLLESRYLIKDDSGKVVEKPDEMFKRVATYIAQAEEESERFHMAAMFEDAMSTLRFLPNSPTLMNAGTGTGQLSACFVLPVEDSIPSIFQAVTDMATIFKSGGGVGLPLSRLRGKGSLVKSTGGQASGPVSFMKVYNITAEVVAQGGKRRGALMGCLRVDHPDIADFIQCKRDLSQFTSFNTSVAITHQFMQAVERGADYDLFDPRTGEKCGALHAPAVWKLIADAAHATGEPGLVFIDRINDAHEARVGDGEPVIGVNPCAELPLRAYECCNLGSINLANMTKGEIGSADLDLDLLRNTTKTAVQFLDDVITMNKYPLPQIQERTLKSRKIGLGVMGLAEYLIERGILYGSPEAEHETSHVMHEILMAAEDRSRALAASRGPYMKGKDRRNATLLAVAPTGSISMIAGVTGSIEPIFLPMTYRQSMLDGKPFWEINQLLYKLLPDATLMQKDEDICRDFAEGKRTLTDMGVKPELARLFRCAHEIHPQEHLLMQSAAQRYVDNAVSKTINLPASATPSEVSAIFMDAFSMGCKGITVYRDGCRENQPMSAGKGKTDTRLKQAPDARMLASVKTDFSEPTGAGSTEKIDATMVRSWMKDLGIKEAVEKPAIGDPSIDMVPSGAGYIQPADRPHRLPGNTVMLKTGCGTLFVTITKNGEKHFEVFSRHGKAGVCSQAQCEAIGRLASLCLRCNIDPEEVAHQLRGITCHQPFGMGDNKVLSCADGIAIALLEELGKEKEPGAKPVYAGSCPKCGAAVVREANCTVCKACGWDKCG